VFDRELAFDLLQEGRANVFGKIVNAIEYRLIEVRQVALKSDHQSAGSVFDMEPCELADMRHNLA